MPWRAGQSKASPLHAPTSPSLPTSPRQVIDRINGVAYVALSERADKALAEVRGTPDASDCGPRPAGHAAPLRPLARTAICGMPAWPQVSSHPAPLPCPPQRWVSQLGYKDLVTFVSTDGRGGTVYHTNVMMAIGTGGC